MPYLYTGEVGTPLREILQQLNNKNYPVIMCRCLWTDTDGNENDDLFGYCKYENGVLEPLDGDSYSLNNLYIKWEEYEDDDNINLCVWEQGSLEEN